MIFTRNGNVINAIRQPDYYDNTCKTTNLCEVINEYTTEIAEEEEGSKNTRTGNVAYDFDSIDPMLRLPDEVWKKANIIEPFSNESSMRQWAGEYNSEKSDWLLSEKTNYGVYAYIEDSDGFFLYEVDQVGSIIRDSNRREIDIQLRIVPAKMTMKPVMYSYSTTEGRNATLDNAFYVPMLMTSSSIDKKPDRFSINNAVNPNAEQDSVSPPERIEVAYYDGGQNNVGTYTPPDGAQVIVQIYLPTGIPFVREDDAYFRELFTTTGTHKLLLLKQGIPGGMFDILTEGKKIDTRCRKTFGFLDKVDSTEGVFIIRGRKYACEKVEYSCDDNGISPLKRGYFYEIND